MLLSLHSLSKRYPGAAEPVFDDLSFTLAEGESLALTGESGSGKSTLMHIIGALDKPSFGQVIFDGHRVDEMTDQQASAYRRRDVALVFQQFNLVPALTVAENLTLHARLGGISADPPIDDLLYRLGLPGLGGRSITELSGGQQQRVAIGRAIAMRPRLLLADEPTGNLDEKTSESVLELMFALVRESGASLLVVTHSASLAARTDRHLHLSNGRLDLLRGAD